MNFSPRWEGCPAAGHIQTLKVLQHKRTDHAELRSVSAVREAENLGVTGG